MKWRGWQSRLIVDHAAITALSFDYLPELFECATRCDRIAQHRPRVVGSRNLVREKKHFGSQSVCHFHQVIRTFTSQRLDRLDHLERISARETERTIHRCE